MPRKRCESTAFRHRGLVMRRGCDEAELLQEFVRKPMLSCVHETATSDEQRAQLVFRIVQSLGNGQRGSPCRVDLRNHAAGIQRRGGKRRIEFHSLAVERRWSTVSLMKRVLDAGAALFERGKPNPRGDRRHGERNAQRCISMCGKRPVQRGTNIVDRRFVIFQPSCIGWSFPEVFCACVQVTKMLRMATRNHVGFTRIGKLASRVVTRRVQKTIAHGIVADVRRQHRLCHQARDRIDHTCVSQIFVLRHGGRGSERKHPWKYSQPAQHDAFSVGQQLMTPIKRGQQSLLPLRSRAAPLRERGKPVVEQGEQLMNAERGHSSGRKLNS